MALFEKWRLLLYFVKNPLVISLHNLFFFLLMIIDQLHGYTTFCIMSVMYGKHPRKNAL